jgi:hypothetical protein
MGIAEGFVPVYVWPAVRYTGEVLAFPTGAGSKLSEDLVTGAFEIIDRGLPPQNSPRS